MRALPLDLFEQPARDFLSVNLLDRILATGNISIGFVSVESKMKNVKYGRIFGSRLYT
jgi:hypothetical protein